MDLEVCFGSQKAVSKDLVQSQAQIKTYFSIIPAVALAQVKSAALKRFLNSPHVKYVVPVRNQQSARKEEHGNTLIQIN